MDISSFAYAWRLTDERYSLLSDDEMSRITVLPSSKVQMIWKSVCDADVIERCSFIEQVVKHDLPIYLADCGWGDDGKEKLTQRRFSELVGQSASGVVLILYDCETGLAVSSDLLCSRWSDFCYPSDSLILVFDNRRLLYYEDVVYSLS